MFSVTPVIDLVILNKDEVEQAIANLSGPYDDVIQEDLPETRQRPAFKSFSSLEATAPRPRIPKLKDFPGGGYVDQACVDLGVNTRKDLRELQDYLASESESPVAVSNTLFYIWASFRLEGC